MWVTLALEYHIEKSEYILKEMPSSLVSFAMLKTLNKSKWIGKEGSSVVKDTLCYCIKLRFGSKHPHIVLQNHPNSSWAPEVMSSWTHGWIYMNVGEKENPHWQTFKNKWFLKQLKTTSSRNGFTQRTCWGHHVGKPK